MKKHYMTFLVLAAAFLIGGCSSDGATCNQTCGGSTTVLTSSCEVLCNENFEAQCSCAAELLARCACQAKVDTGAQL